MSEWALFFSNPPISMCFNHITLSEVMRPEAGQGRESSFTVLLFSQFPGENTASTWGQSREALGSVMRQREKVYLWGLPLLWFLGEAIGEAG